MKTIEIMTPDPQCIDPGDTLTQAAVRMKACNVGILPVCKQGRLVGVLTDRDIAIRAVANGLDPDHVTVHTVMSRLIISCFADQDQEEAATMMESHHVRRLPVLDRDERLIGIISLGDLVVRSDNEDRGLKIWEQLSGERDRFRPPARPAR